MHVHTACYVLLSVVYTNPHMRACILHCIQLHSISTVCTVCVGAWLVWFVSIYVGT
jgi:hypothetical protein